MPDQSITCTACGKRIPLTRALQADLETSLRTEFESVFAARERELHETFRAHLQRAEAQGCHSAEQRMAAEIEALQEQLTDQARMVSEMRALEVALRKRERELQREKQELELSVVHQIDMERAAIVEETRARFDDQHRLKDVEKERQLADMRRQIEDLKRRAEQGSQQLQGEAIECELEALLSDSCRLDRVCPVRPGVRGGDIHHVVIDDRGRNVGAILWECKNTRHWSDMWLVKLKADQRAIQAEVAVLVTACLPKSVSRFAYVDGVLVTDFASVPGVVAILRAQLIALAQARHGAVHKEERLELLHRYLLGTTFRHRVEAVVDAFSSMRQDLDQERRAAERQWARRARQLEAVTLTISGMYGDLPGLVPALPSIRLLDLPTREDEPQPA